MRYDENIMFHFSPRLNAPNMFWQLDFYFEQIIQSLHKENNSTE